MTLYEIEGFLRGKCLPGDLLVGESTAEYIFRKLKERDALAAENAGLKANLMFWDADNPESPYDSPEEIASECELNYNEELVVQVAAKLPNRTYRVCESWEVGDKLELVEGSELQTPATDAAIAKIEARGVQKFSANQREWAAHWEKHGVTDGSASRCLMVAQDADKFAAQLRKEAGK